MGPLWFILGATAVIAAFLLASRYWKKKRSEALRRLSRKIGFTFVGVAARVPHLQAPPDDIRNVMRGKAAGFDALLYDYDCGSGGRTGPWTRAGDNYSQTVAAFKLPGSSPQFELFPETFQDQIGNVFGYQDIDCDSNPGFSRRYQLRGDEPQVRQLFNSNLLSFFEQLEKGWSVEMSGPWLMAYKHEQRLKPDVDQFRQFLHTATSIARAVSGQGDLTEEMRGVGKSKAGRYARWYSYFTVGLFGTLTPSFGPFLMDLLFDSESNPAERRILRALINAVSGFASYALLGFLSGAVWPDTGWRWGLLLVAPVVLYLTLSLVFGSLFLSDVALTLAFLLAACALAHLGSTWTIRRRQPGYERSDVPTVERTSAWMAAVGTIAIVGYGVFWVIFTFFYAQSHIRSEGQHSTVSFALSPESGVELALFSEIGLVDSKLELMQGNNLDIYVPRDSWQNVLLPISSSIRKIGKTWCDQVQQTYLPTVRIREIHDGRTFASYSCALDRVSVNSP